MLVRRDLADLPDAVLVARVRGGDRDAYEPLVDRHQTLLYRHAVGMGLDHDTSLDIVQDAFVKAYQRLGECHEPAHFRSWVFRIARNLCLDHLRNVRRLSLPMSHVAGVERIARDVEGDSERTLREALQRLPVALRDAFLLKHDAGYTYEEIAELMNASPSAVKMRVSRARDALREFLIAHGVTSS